MMSKRELRADVWAYFAFWVLLAIEFFYPGVLPVFPGKPGQWPWTQAVAVGAACVAISWRTLRTRSGMDAYWRVLHNVMLLTALALFAVRQRIGVIPHWLGDLQGISLPVILATGSLLAAVPLIWPPGSATSENLKQRSVSEAKVSRS